MATTENIELIALQKMINGSEAMFERRRRILREARSMIHQGGLEDLNMRELSRRANVSTKTIYNAFGSKETVIALAIHTYFQQFVAHVSFEEDVKDFDGALNRQTTSTLRDLDMPNYMQAVVLLYFSPTLDLAIRAVLVDLATRSWVKWLQHVEDERELRSGVVLRELLLDLSNIQYACIQEWCSGSITNDVFVRRTLSGILMLLMGVCSGKAQEELSRSFSLLQSDADYRERLLSAARERINDALDSMTKIRGRRRPAAAKAVL